MTTRRGRWALLGCLLVVAVLVAVRPDPATDFRRRTVEIEVGQIGALRQFDITATQVRRATAVPVGSSSFVTEQALVVVDLRAAVRRAPTSFTGLSLVTEDGAAYAVRPEFASAGLTATQPGFTITSTVVFEVPTERLPGARLVIDPDGQEFDVFDTAVRIDLGLSARSPVAVITEPLPAARTEVTR